MIQSKSGIRTAAFLPSPSPDRAANRIKTTGSPSTEIQRYILASQNTLKKSPKLKIIPVSPKGISLQHYHNPADVRRIRELQEELKKYERYMEQYEKLGERNKKMEEQMYQIMTELQRRNKQEMAKNKSHHRFMTIESSVDPVEINEGSRENLQIEDLYDYMEEMQEMIEGFVSRNREMEAEIKKNVNKDVNEMEKRLMNYIFGLEEKLSEATFRNHEMIKSIETFRQNTPLSTQRPHYDEQRRPEERKLQENKKSDEQVRLENTVYPESLISMMNIEVSSSMNSPTLEYSKTVRQSSTQMKRDVYQNLGHNSQQKTSKKQERKVSLSLGIESQLCENCQKYIKAIEQLKRDKLRLEDEIARLQSQHHTSKISSDNSKVRIMLESNSEHSEKDDDVPTFKVRVFDEQKGESTINKLKSTIKEEGSSSVKKRIHKQSEQLAEKMSVLQSHINIMVDTSNDDSIILERNSKEMKPSPSEISIAERNLLADKIKGQLVNVMQTLQEIIHSCDSESKDCNLLTQLQNQNRMQEMMIGDLEEDIARLRMELEQTKTEKEQMQKFWRTQVRQQELVYSPRSEPIERISCVDPSVTKQKINQILASIRSFESEYRQYSSNDNYQ